MITAVDTNVLLDLLNPAEPHTLASREALKQASTQGALVVTEIVYAEVSPMFPDPKDLDLFFRETGIRVDSLGLETLRAAGMAWAEYSRRRAAHAACPDCGATLPDECSNCGRKVGARRHILADFIIGAHAVNQADRLMTRDKGYYRTYFPELVLA